MSTAVVEPVIEQAVEKPANLRLVTAGTPVPAEQDVLSDPHPLLPVFVIGAVAMLLAMATIGSIVAGLLLRNSGVMAQ